MSTMEQPQSQRKELLDLPKDLILCIVDASPPASAACFALCNQSLSALISKKSWAILDRKWFEERFEFATSIARDLPSYSPCQICAKLHPRSDVPWPQSIQSSRHKCIYYASHLVLSGSLPYRLTFTHIQLAMERYRYGNESGVPLEAFAYSQVTSGEDEVIGEYTRLFSAEPQIVSGELLLRSQL
jgi:hypothetical protein